MKRSSFTISLLLCLALLTGCHSQPKTPANNENKTVSSGTAGGGNGVTNDSAAVTDKNKAISHSAPEQARIDSLKNAKTKDKQKK